MIVITTTTSTKITESPHLEAGYLWLNDWSSELELIDFQPNEFSACLRWDILLGLKPKRRRRRRGKRWGRSLLSFIASASLYPLRLLVIFRWYLVWKLFRTTTAQRMSTNSSFGLELSDHSFCLSACLSACLLLFHWSAFNGIKGCAQLARKLTIDHNHGILAFEGPFKAKFKNLIFIEW